MTDTLEPRLTRLDERVLAALPYRGGGGIRAARVHRQVTRWLEPARVTTRRDGEWTEELRPERLAPGEPTLDDIRLILRGLAHLGRARHRHGWWSRS